MRGQVRFALGLVACLAGAGQVAGADRPLDRAKLVLKRARSESLVFASGDPSLLFPGVGGPDDPATGSPGGALIELFSTAEPGGAVLSAPRGAGLPGWTATTDRFKFANRAAPGASSPVRTIVIREARSIRVAAKRTGLNLAIPQGAVGIRITTGTLRNCAFFGPTTVRKDVPGRFDAQAASAAAIPDCSDAALGGVASTTTTTTTLGSTTTSSTIPGVCGDGVVNQPSEQCDGADRSGCPPVQLFCGPPGFATACRCCTDGGLYTQLVGCCNPFSILIPGPEYAGSCVNTRCDPPFTCSGTDQCQADHTCCAAVRGTCILTVFPQPMPLNACCPGLECRGQGDFGIACCVPDGAACTSDGDCCAKHCGPSGTCETCRSGGAACVNDFECCSISCNAGTCDACGAPGRACFAGASCCSGFCNPSTFTCF